MRENNLRALLQLADSDVDDSVTAGRPFTGQCYDQKGKYKSAHTDLNKQCVKFATSKHACLYSQALSMRVYISAAYLESVFIPHFFQLD